MTITLKEVNDNDLEFLYDLLKERDSRANISHLEMPSFEQHVKFVKNKPYTKWYVVYDEEQKVGSIYLSKMDEIGIFIKNEMQNKKIGKNALELLMKLNPRERFLANVSPKNEKSIKFFTKNNFSLIQHTFELRNKN